MPNWKKVVTSGSNAVLNQVTASKFIGDGSALTNLPSQTGTITALNNQSANRLVTIGSTTTELDGEANLVFDGTNLGIGTISPEHLLQVKSSAQSTISIKAGTNKQSNIEFENDGTGFSVGHDVSDNGGHNFFIHDRENSGTRLFIDNSGDVGIGTTSPNAKLEIAGSTIFGNTPTATHKFTGSLDISGSVDNATPTLKVHGSGSGIFEVKGTNGTLFSVNDIMEGSIFSANTIAGIPVIEAFSDQKVTLGSPSAPVTITALSSSMDVSGSLRAVPKTDSLTGSNNLDLSKNTNFNITITGNITLTPIGLNGRDGQSGIITLIQDSSGGHSITLNSLFKTPRGDSIAFDTTANGISLMSYYVVNTSNVAVNYLGPFS